MRMIATSVVLYALSLLPASADVHGRSEIQPQLASDEVISAVAFPSNDEILIVTNRNDGDESRVVVLKGSRVLISATVHGFRIGHVVNATRRSQAYHVVVGGASTDSQTTYFYLQLVVKDGEATVLWDSRLLGIDPAREPLFSTDSKGEVWAMAASFVSGGQQTGVEVISGPFSAAAPTLTAVIEAPLPDAVAGMDAIDLAVLRGGKVAVACNGLVFVVSPKKDSVVRTLVPEHGSARMIFFDEGKDELLVSEAMSSDITVFRGASSEDKARRQDPDLVLDGSDPLLAGGTPLRARGGSVVYRASNGENGCVARLSSPDKGPRTEPFAEVPTSATHVQVDEESGRVVWLERDAPKTVFLVEPTALR